ncbi:MAG: UbiA prenyltransferase family protein [Roseburia sp.]|nr:UbiA prenyltransferase family protein [Roseburia sp.]
MMNKWIKELRITHYLKNCLIFLPAFFGGTITSGSMWKNLLVGFMAYSLGASAVYLMNDIKDVEKDRMHPKKCTRPIAAGEISIKAAVTAAVGLLALCGLVLGFFAEQSVKMAAFAVFGVYLADNILYSVLGLKKVPLLDVALLVLGFYLRVLMGSVLTGIEISAWLYLVVISGAFYLAFGKRRNELKVVGNDGRDVLAGYTEHFLDKAMYTCMTMAIIFFALWCIQLGEGQKYLMLVPVLMLICFKYSMDVEQDDSDGDPMNVILHDWVLIGLGMLFVIMMFVLLYV